jgi:hypothetical protein
LFQFGSLMRIIYSVLVKHDVAEWEADSFKAQSDPLEPGLIAAVLCLHTATIDVLQVDDLPVQHVSHVIVPEHQQPATDTIQTKEVLLQSFLAGEPESMLRTQPA